MEWQTWRTQNPLVATPCGFKSRHRHLKIRTRRCADFYFFHFHSIKTRNFYIKDKREKKMALFYFRLLVIEKLRKPIRICGVFLSFSVIRWSRRCLFWKAERCTRVRRVLRGCRLFWRWELPDRRIATRLYRNGRFPGFPSLFHRWWATSMRFCRALFLPCLSS